MQEIAAKGAFPLKSHCQRFANETPEPNANKRHWSSPDSSVFSRFSRTRGSLITVWLEVRVLPGPPRSPPNLWSQRLC